MPSGVYVRTEEIKKKVNERMVGEKNPAKREEVREKIREKSKEMWKSEEHRREMSEKHKGEKNPMKKEENKRKLSKVFKGKSHPCFLSQSQREKLSNWMKNGHSAYMQKFIKNPSKEELKLREIVKELYPDLESQHRVLNYSLDIALLKYKVAIEFDGWYHFDCQHDIDYHKKRQQEVEKEGWKFIRYNIFQPFPTKEQVLEDIKNII